MSNYKARSLCMTKRDAKTSRRELRHGSITWLFAEEILQDAKSGKQKRDSSGRIESYVCLDQKNGRDLEALTTRRLPSGDGAQKNYKLNSQEHKTREKKKK